MPKPAPRSRGPHSSPWCDASHASPVSRGGRDSLTKSILRHNVVKSPPTRPKRHVPLDRLSRRADRARALRHRAQAFADRAVAARARSGGERQRRRLRARLVRRARGARPLPRGASGLVGREPAAPVPPHPLAPVLRPCARLDRHPDDAPELPSVRARALDVHAQRADWRLVADPPQGGGADTRHVLQIARRHHRLRSGVPGDTRRCRRRGRRPGGGDLRHARAADRDGAPRAAHASRCASPRRSATARAYTPSATSTTAAPIRCTTARAAATW